ncbi:DUF6169 family protein [Spirosoma panaciterrae]|uniref:DUF6169 family protein n=1 Tax=Spirosoma panaciterrae TaxID=496058 RepID=UPI0003675A93|nr:DUF6169 family protein [Spirosoma panaciterrae]
MSQKNQPESNSSNPLPYPLRSVEDGLIFVTELGVTYKIGFADDSVYVSESSFAHEVFSFSITPIAGQVRQKDPRVEQTVIRAILLTFDTLPDAVINYVCSLDNDQQIARSRLFHRWYLKAGTTHFIKLDFTDHENRIYTSVLFRSNHPAEAEIRNLFAESFTK